MRNYSVAKYQSTFSRTFAVQHQSSSLKTAYVEKRPYQYLPSGARYVMTTTFVDHKERVKCYKNVNHDTGYFCVTNNPATG